MAGDSNLFGNLFDPLNSYIFGDAKSGAISAEDLAQRRKIAIALATRQRAFPKTVGEGLTYFGEKIAEGLDDRALAQAEAKLKSQGLDFQRGIPQDDTVTPGAVPAAPTGRLSAAEPVEPPPAPPTPPPQSPASAAASTNPPPPPTRAPALARLASLTNPQGAPPAAAEPLPPPGQPAVQIPGQEPAPQTGRAPVRDMLAQSLAAQNTPPPVASGEQAGAQYAGATGQAPAPPGVRLASAAPDTMTDATPEPMGSMAGAGIAAAVAPQGRDQIANTLVAQAGGAPPPVPAPKPPVAPPPVTPSQGIQPAPKPGYPNVEAVRGGQPLGPEPQPPTATPPSAREEYLRRGSLNPNLPDDVKRSADAEVKLLQEQRKQRDTTALENYKLQKQDWFARRGEQEKFEYGTPERNSKLLNEAQQLIDPTKGKDTTVRQIIGSQLAINNARSALDQGIFTGVTAPLEMTKARLLTAMGFQPDPRVSATQQFEAFIMPIVAAARQAQSGGANISDNDMKLALRAAAGDITLDEKTIRGVLNSIERMQTAIAVDHQGRVNAVADAYGAEPRVAEGIRNIHSMPMEQIVPRAAVGELLKNANDPEERRQFDESFKTPGLADRIIRQRVQRFQQSQQPR